MNLPSRGLDFAVVEPVRLEPYTPSEKIILGGEQVTGVLVRHHCEPRNFLGIEVEKLEDMDEQQEEFVFRYVSHFDLVTLRHRLNSLFTEYVHLSYWAVSLLTNKHVSRTLIEPLSVQIAPKQTHFLKDLRSTTVRWSCGLNGYLE